MAAPATAYRTHHTQGAAAPASEPHRPPIAGGTLSVIPLALLAATLAYCRGIIPWFTFRVWAALVEVRARHDIAMRRGAAAFPFTVAHVVNALGGDADASMRQCDVDYALEDIAALGVVVMTKKRIIFVDDVDGILDPQLRDEVAEAIEDLEIGQTLHLGMSMPRQIVSQWRRQARGSHVAVAVLVGLLLRTMMENDKYPDYRGCVKIGWLQRFSGGTRSGVKRALRALEASDLFGRLWAEQHVLNRYGQWYRLNPDVPVDGDRAKPRAPHPDSGEADEVAATAAVCDKGGGNNPPPHCTFTENDPPDLNQVSPFGRSKNQVHAYAHKKPGAYQRLQNPQTRNLAPHVTRLPVPWWDIQPQHLKNRSSLENLHRQAVDRGLMPAGDAGLREVAVQVERVLRKAREREIRNPGAVLRWTLEHPEAPRDGAIEDDERARALLADLQGASRDEAAQLMTSVEATVADAAPTGADNDAGCDEGRDESAGEKGRYQSPARCWHDDVYSPHGPVPDFDLPAAAAEGVCCRTCGSVMVDGEWYMEDESAGVEARGTSGEDVGRAWVEADSRSPTGSEVHLERLWSDDTDMNQGVVLASGGSAVSWYVCEHNDTHRRPVRFAGFDLESAAGVDREAGGLFCRTCEGWWVGDRWYRQDDEGGVRWYRRDDGGGVQAEAEAESGGRSAAGLRDPKVGDLACEKVEG